MSGITNLLNASSSRSGNVRFVDSDTSTSTTFVGRGRGLQLFKNVAFDADVTVTFEVSDDTTTWYVLKDSTGADVSAVLAGTGNALVQVPAEAWSLGVWRHLRLVANPKPINGDTAFVYIKVMY